MIEMLTALAIVFSFNAFIEDQHNGGWKAIPVEILDWEEIDIQTFPQADSWLCGRDAAGCYGPKPNTGELVIQIREGLDGAIPKFGGCSILMHELLHAKGWTHDRMAREMPNTNCHPALLENHAVCRDGNYPTKTCLTAQRMALPVHHGP